MVGRDRVVTPAEFWRLHPEEVYWLINSRQPQKMYGKMTEAEVREIYEEEYGPVPGGS